MNDQHISREASPVADASRFERAMAAFDAANAEDPNKELHEGVEYPKELLYAQRMTAMLARFAPGSPETVRLAARCQHIRRWVIPRSEYPMDRVGYHQWRTRLRKFHAETAGEILGELGYGPETLTRVQALLRKEGLKLDPEVQLLEDVICLVFLESYLAEFAERYAGDEAKLIDIIRKTWKKMSPQGQEAALALDLGPELLAVVQKALS